MTMAIWTGDELASIDGAEELRLQSQRSDGSLRAPVTMWVVRAGDEVFVRCMNGRDGAWFGGALTRHQGHIRAGGVSKDVDLVEMRDEGVNDQVDAAYRGKYGRYSSIVDSMVTPDVRAATLRLLPH
ncbi:DUF2255 family protein [Nonomuraea sp. NPDC050663]|uniref:DUF2255 family protein n=1 Tax=Nonomuraea sp. NPDC050663 TaxID=3364370 RepID=UPI0037A7F790